LLLFSHSRTAVSRTEDTDTLRRCASRSRSDLSSSDKRQLYTSVFMHYIVVQNCITLQHNSLMRIMDSTSCCPSATSCKANPNAPTKLTIATRLSRSQGSRNVTVPSAACYRFPAQHIYGVADLYFPCRPPPRVARRDASSAGTRLGLSWNAYTLKPL